MKKLTRSHTDKVIGGVLGGFAEYINVDPTVVRLAYVLITLLSCFAGILFYLIAWIIIPTKGSEEENHHTETEEEKREDNDEELKVENSFEEKV